MRPAFASTKGASAFAVLLLLLLTGPLLAGKRTLPAREQAYSIPSSFFGPYPWIRNQIYDESKDIDVLFIGSSHLLCGIDTPYFQQKLTEKLGRESVVRSVCWGGGDFDALYFIAKDLLEHRRVRTLVFYDESFGKEHNNAMLPVWFRYADDGQVLTSLPLVDKVPYYFGSIAGLPRNLVCLIRSNLPASLSESNFCQGNYNTTNPANRLGSVSSQNAYRASIWEKRPPFVPFKPPMKAQSAEACIYSPTTKNKFTFLNERLPTWQIHFARKFSALAQQHGCKLVLIHMPVLAEQHVANIVEKQFWPDSLSADIDMIGVPPRDFFAGLTDDQCRALYADIVHLNKNGQEYFTPMITPALIEIYEKHAPH